jgi:DNA-directed RNA polymerase specialized sigma24 family protein
MSHRIRPPDPEQRQHVAALYQQHSARVRRIVAAGLRPADQHQADDIAQDVWLTFWQYVLRGNTIGRPGGLLATMARCRVADHYRLARVRREVSTDPTMSAALGGLDREPRRELVAA